MNYFHITCHNLLIQWPFGRFRNHSLCSRCLSMPPHTFLPQTFPDQTQLEQPCSIYSSLEHLPAAQAVQVVDFVAEYLPAIWGRVGVSAWYVYYPGTMVHMHLYNFDSSKNSMRLSSPNKCPRNNSNNWSLQSPEMRASRWVIPPPHTSLRRSLPSLRDSII